jgi:AraC family transcriptional regulator
MQQKKPVAIDVTTIDTRRKVLTQPPLLTSHQAKWKDINLEYYLQSPYESPEHYASHYTLAIRLKNQFGLERWLGESYKSENSIRGDVAIIPPYITHRAVPMKKFSPPCMKMW